MPSVKRKDWIQNYLREEETLKTLQASQFSRSLVNLSFNLQVELRLWRPSSFIGFSALLSGTSGCFNRLAGVGAPRAVAPATSDEWMGAAHGLACETNAPAQSRDQVRQSCKWLCQPSTFKLKFFSCVGSFFSWKFDSCFLYPVFLYALAAIAIPIIIHLFNFQRYKTLVFTNVRFLREVKQQTKQQSQLKHLLVLLARILFITFLVLGFAQPFIPLTDETNHSAHTVSIFLDNSFSMNTNNPEGRLFDQARSRIEGIVAAYKPTDQFQLLTHDFESKHQFLVNGKEVESLLDQVTITPAVKPLSHILSRQKDLLSNNSSMGHHSYIVSDFQKQNTDLEKIPHDSTTHVRLIPLTPQAGSNIYIDSCWWFWLFG